MPRQVEYEARRRHIADAVCRLAEERGLEGVTLRDVARRAEVSMGAVQRCFRTREQMLAFTLAHVGEQAMARARNRLTSSPAQSARSALGHTAHQVALVEEEQRAQARVWLAFVAQAVVSPGLAELLRTAYGQAQELFAGLLAEADCAGEPAREARRLLALTDGLTTQVLVGHLDLEQAREVLEDHLRGLWQDA
ncbi:TetR family transcriptional regulator C-terminal domain-containing protein [Streptomyces sp. XM4193]|uniref:TetR/AcrR family transcriptional regulator n=1 Tax=Streptomyces sp. XM4193 TaxID=2929782 RepID=UPI001FFAC878|nr:TetR family transcriptional regulator C-terminal domain-containing protein [Streptomyces sp. XM4193]MCK1797136.1 TetR family transcriptional regulator C-terminal domain-containing protein [Streptomyces sp. XM4193]